MDKISSKKEFSIILNAVFLKIKLVKLTFAVFYLDLYDLYDLYDLGTVH